MAENVQIGRLVRSAAGRDKGKFYLIYDVLDEAFVRVIDGEKRTIDNPKKKNIKHLELLPAIAEAVAEKLRMEQAVLGNEISEAVRTLGLSHKYD